ncbi:MULTISPECIES: NUDIX domain-containing protein [Roseobacteraceae]|uniref:NUDIX domain-containing protein n=1 Tax=Roseobacteraceae TaxID=2854170 RepID=UPI0031D64D2E
MIEGLSIRPIVRAVIRKGPLVLVQVKQRPDGQRYMMLPDGRQEPGETMQDCVARECPEETGAARLLRDIFFVADVFRFSGDKRRVRGHEPGHVRMSMPAFVMRSAGFLQGWRCRAGPPLVGQPLTPDMVIPRTKARRAKRKTSIIGIVTTVAAAKVRP